MFPDGRLLSLPIPDRRSTICYKDIRWHEYNLGTIVSELTRGRIRTTQRAHLDPDLYRKSLLRHRGWKPIFGQTGSARVIFEIKALERVMCFCSSGCFKM